MQLCSHCHMADRSETSPSGLCSHHDELFALDLEEVMAISTGAPLDSWLEWHHGHESLLSMTLDQVRALGPDALVEQWRAFHGGDSFCWDRSG